VSIVILLVSASGVNAGLITSLSGVDVEGTLYDVSFHARTSFDSLWDADRDGVYDDLDGSVFNSAPMFFGDSTLAAKAALAVILALGNVDFVLPAAGSPFDRFIVPAEILPGHFFYFWTDRDRRPNVDRLFGEQWSTGAVRDGSGPLVFASFTPHQVPEPTTLFLFALGLSGFGIIRRKRYK